MAINAYIESNKDRFVNELLDLLKIPSISTDINYKDAIHKAAAYIEEKLTKSWCSSY